MYQSLSIDLFTLSCQSTRKKKKKKTTPFGANLLRSQVFYRAALSQRLLAWQDAPLFECDMDEVHRSNCCQNQNNLHAAFQPLLAIIVAVPADSAIAGTATDMHLQLLLQKSSNEAVVLHTNISNSRCPGTRCNSAPACSCHHALMACIHFLLTHKYAVMCKLCVACRCPSLAS